MNTRFGLVSISDTAGLPVAAISVDNKVAVVSSLANLADYPTIDTLLQDWDAAMVHLQAAADDMAAGKVATLDQGEATLHMPHNPPQVFCTGANYHKHVVEIIMDRFADRFREEFKTDEAIHAHVDQMMKDRAASGTPYIFTRIASSFAGPFDDITLPGHATQPDWEAELALVFKKGGSNISRDSAMDHIAGYMVVNDITNRDQIFTADPKDLGADWLHAKHSPGYFPMGPMIVPAQFIEDPHNLQITLKLNGKMMQNEKSNDMIFDIPRQIEVLSSYARIMTGDVLATGSPSGNGTHYNRYLQDGDVMEVSVEGLGTQISRCIAAK